MKDKGFVTIPTDKTFVEGTKRLIKLWGADAIRDCDGVSLPNNLKQFNCDVYKAYFIVREDHEYAKNHKEYLQNVALISKRYTAFKKTLEINLMKDIFKKTLEVNIEDYKKYWQVYDRTEGVIHKDWDYIGKDVVEIRNAKLYHEYTVSFFAKNLWDPVQVYNYHSNNWKNVPIDIDLDPIFPEALDHMLKRMEQWLKNNPDVTVVRFTTFFYNFLIVYKEGTKQLYWDWHTYNMAASPSMFKLFKKTYGYEITLEDVVNEGYLANRFVLPTKACIDFVDLVQKKCSEWAKLFVDLCHKYHKKAMMFDGDHHIGTEPYSKYFKNIGLDAVVGAPHSGIYIRQLAEIKGVKFKEGRLNPYFFPNECPSDKKGVEFITYNWNLERRGLLRKPIDRIGFGGYLKLADSYPQFKLKLKEVCDEFRLIKSKVGPKGSHTVVKVALISFWGKRDTWMFNDNFVDDVHQDSNHLSALLRALAGQPIDVDFISFDDVINKNLDKYDCLITSGVVNSSFHGGKLWTNPLLVSKIREYVANGKGFIGIGDATGYQYQGRYFQLSDVMGVEKDNMFTLFERREPKTCTNKHWIINDIDFDDINFGHGTRSVYSLGADVIKCSFDKEKLSFSQSGINHNGHVNLATNTYQKGRSVYLSGLVDSFNAERLIYKTILWASKKENQLLFNFSTNPKSDCYYYESSNSYAIINNSKEAIKTYFYNNKGIKKLLSLKPNEIKWIN